MGGLEVLIVSIQECGIMNQGVKIKGELPMLVLFFIYLFLACIPLFTLVIGIGMFLEKVGWRGQQAYVGGWVFGGAIWIVGCLLVLTKMSTGG